MNNKTRYFFFRNDQHQVHFEFDPNDPQCLRDVGYEYFGRVCHHLNSSLGSLGLEIVVTPWTVHELPRYGRNVVALITQDEFGRAPRYLDKVGAVFKTCGLSPFAPEAFRYGGAVEKLVSGLGQLKFLALDRGGHAKAALQRISGAKLAPVVSIPLGCWAYSDTEFVPFEDRPNHIFFAGSVQHAGKVTIPRPKELARRRMLDALAELEERNSDVRIARRLTGGFEESLEAGPAGYLRTMMSTQLCVVPRGANLETFRFYEAIRSGCIPIMEAVPDEEHYRGAPIVRLNDWSELAKVVPALLSDKDRLLELHRQALMHWESKCSEAAVAEKIVRRLREADSPLGALVAT